MKINPKRLIISLLLPQLAGAIGSIFTAPGVKLWYPTLIKPSFNPPNWIFVPVWTTLFILMGIAFYIIWESKKEDKKCAFRFFFIQLFFNVLWTVIFFGLHIPSLAFYEILLLWVIILATIIHFYRVSKLAGYLMIPYLAWVTFAAVLNIVIWQINL